MEADTMLYHAGCGRPLFTEAQVRTGTMALACGCGAAAPIAVTDLDGGADTEGPLPQSLAVALALIALGASPFPAASRGPHIEYYLGFDDTYDCPAKRAWERTLRDRLGLCAFAECPEPACIREPERQRARLARSARPS